MTNWKKRAQEIHAECQRRFGKQSLSPIESCDFRGVEKQKIYDCSLAWVETDEAVEELMGIADPIARNQAFNAAYAQLYLDHKELRWSGVVAFASKQVGCGMQDAQALMNDYVPDLDMPDAVYRALVKGNKAIFKQTYPALRFYGEYGLEGLRQCAKAHKPPVKKEFLESFDLVAQGKLGEGAEEMLKYEQLDLLPKEVYKDEEFVKAVRLNQSIVKTVGEIPAIGVKKLKVAFSADCEGGPEVVFDGWHLDDDEQRWPYAKQVGETFQSLVEQQSVFMYGQLQKIVNYQQPVYEMFDEFGHPGLELTTIKFDVDTKPSEVDTNTDD
ncbi:MAG: DUF2515 family protein [Thioploca sp.]|nr:DUF2515 family protein [Thioploca sp.]